MWLMEWVGWPRNSFGYRWNDMGGVKLLLVVWVSGGSG